MSKVDIVEDVDVVAAMVEDETIAAEAIVVHSTNAEQAVTITTVEIEDVVAKAKGMSPSPVRLLASPSLVWSWDSW